MDKFKQYLQDHAKELEVDAPGARVWKNINEQHIAPKQKGKLISFVRYAAAACIIALAGIGVFHIATNPKNNVAVAIQSIKDTLTNNATVVPKQDSSNSKNTLAETVIEVPDNDAENAGDNKGNIKGANNNNKSVHKPSAGSEMDMLNYVETGFTKVINIEKQRVNSSPLYAESPAYFNDFKNRMMQMDNDEKLIRKDIKEKGPDNQMIDQMINIYQQKLNLLRQLQTEMNKLNNRYKQNRPASDSVGTYFLNI